MDDFLTTIPISALNQFAYCPRRCYLIHAENEFTDNIHTLRGNREHERVDQLHYESSAGIRIEYALPVWSERLGLSGRCDVVEFHPDGKIYPVEYKHGKRKQWLNDDLQVAAQGICLEEMTHQSITAAAIYHHGSRRRRKLMISAELRQQVVETTQTVRRLLEDSNIPAPTNEHSRCPDCSLYDICRPDLIDASKQLHALRKSLFIPDDET